MYQVSVSNCPGTECGVFCISIFDIISWSALVLFILLRASKYHYNKGDCLLRISVLQQISNWWVIIIVPIYDIVEYTCVGIFAAIFHWPTTVLLLLLYFNLNCHGSLLLSQISNMFICGISNKFVLQQSNNSITFNFWSSTTSAETNFFLSTQATTERQSTIGTWVIVLRDILTQTKNCLSSGNLWQYINVHSQCGWSPWTWTWHIMYFDSCSLFVKRPGIV